MGLPLSVVIVAYDIGRELPRTLHSLSASYQRDLAADDYEVIVVDNGSPEPIDEAVFSDLKGNFELVRVERATPSPVPAVNLGLESARGDTVGVMIDGARLASPGLLSLALDGSHRGGGAGVVTLGWYLGFDYQRRARLAGWTEADEDRLLDEIEWPSDGYRLFEVSSLDESSVGGWPYGVFGESNGLFLPAHAWRALDGYDARFDAPGGGLANYDTLRRATELDALSWVVLLGEATFHQIHGGIATEAPPDKQKRAIEEWRDQYRTIRGNGFEPVVIADPVFLGKLPRVLWPRYAHALNSALDEANVIAPSMPSAVPCDGQASGPTPAAARWAELAHEAARQGRDSEAQAFARHARENGTVSRETELLLAHATGADRVEELPDDRRVPFLVESGDATARDGDLVQAEDLYRQALRLDPGNADAYVGLTRLAMPGPGYYDRLWRLHEYLNPPTYLEVGVFEGTSLSMARPPTIAVAVDPDPQIRLPISVECHVYRETSEDFFTKRDVRALFGGRGPSLAFIDGLHEFPAALTDFAHVEAVCEPDTIIVLHDMIPFDEITQRPDRVFEFYTGDVWKLLHCLADVRSDLSWATIRTPPSGLTLVTGLDPSSTVLRDRHDELVDRFGALSFDEARNVPGRVVENDWNDVSALLDEWRTVRSRAGEREEAQVSLDAPDADALARRVRELEEIDASRRRELDELHRLVRGDGLPTWMDPDSAQAELERLRRTKLFRAAQPFRRLYGRLRASR